MKVEKPKYDVFIPEKILHDNRLSSAEKVLYGELDAVKDQDGFASMTNAYIAWLYGVSKRTVKRWLSHLEELGLITVTVDSSFRKIFVKEV